MNVVRAPRWGTGAVIFAKRVLLVEKGAVDAWVEIRKGGGKEE